MSRVARQLHVLEDDEMKAFRYILRKVADFCGFDVLTYCLMDNHFHILVSFQPQNGISDQELLRRYTRLYGNEGKFTVISPSRLESLLLEGGRRAEEWREKLLKRMGDLSMFMKMLKQRFSIWMNHREKKHGTFWAEPFKATRVDRSSVDLLKVAAYIDLNPIRAKLCKKPETYAFSGYGEAVRGNHLARSGYAKFIPGFADWDELNLWYQVLLYGRGVFPKKGSQKSGRFDWEEMTRIFSAACQTGVGP